MNITSDWLYPEGYQPLPIAEQVARLQELFPELIRGANLQIAERELPDGAEGWAAIVDWKRLGKSYAQVFEQRIIPTCVTNLTHFKHWLRNSVIEKCLRQNERSVVAWERIADEQAGFDIFIVPIQFGASHRGCSGRRARQMFAENEFGLGIIAISCLALTHHERFQRWELVHIDGVGDDYDWYADGQWAHIPLFFFNGGKIRIGVYSLDAVHDPFGPASAFLINDDPGF